MNNETVTDKTRSSRWLIWIVGLLALIWHGLGCVNFAMQLNPDMLVQMPESHRAIAEQRPMWATAAFALTVICGAIGGLLLLFKQRVSIELFILSLLGAIVATLHAVAMGGALSVFNSGQIVLAVIGPIAFGVFLVWFARRALS